MKIKKFRTFAANLPDKTEYVIHIRNLKQALSHTWFLKNVHTVIKFNQNAWLIDINAWLIDIKMLGYWYQDRSKKSQKWFWKRFVDK